jgi:hypothetical protein
MKNCKENYWDDQGFILNHGNWIIGVSVLDHKIIKVIYFLWLVELSWGFFWSVFVHFLYDFSVTF